MCKAAVMVVGLAMGGHKKAGEGRLDWGLMLSSLMKWRPGLGGPGSHAT